MNNKPVITLIIVISLTLFCDLNTEEEVYIENDPCDNSEELACECDRTWCDEEYECECWIDYSLVESENCYVAGCFCECIDPALVR